MPEDEAKKPAEVEDEPAPDTDEAASQNAEHAPGEDSNEQNAPESAVEDDSPAEAKPPESSASEQPAQEPEASEDEPKADKPSESSAPEQPAQEPEASGDEPKTDKPSEGGDEPEDAAEPETGSAEEIEESLNKGGSGPSRIDLRAELQKVADTKGSEWEPTTRLGRLVKGGKVSSMSQALASGLPLREAEIVDILLPNLEDEVTSVNMVQRMTDSGRRVRFSIQTVVGNGDGFVGIGMAKGREVGPTIRRAIDNAKLNLIEIRRGCGSWECGCGTPHTVPFEVRGKCASVEIAFRPAPQGVGLAVSEISQKVLKLAGIKDAWGFARGQTRTTVNACQAAFEALSQITRMRVSPVQMERIELTQGATAGEVHTEWTPEPEPEPDSEAAAPEAAAAGGERA